MPFNSTKIRNALHTGGVQTAQELTQRLGISQATFSRAWTKETGVLRMGSARSTRYGLLRQIGREEQSQWPLYGCDEAGRFSHLGTLSALHTDAFLFAPVEDGPDWMLAEEFSDGLFPSLPWFLDDLRPQGYIGRRFAGQRGDGLGIGTHPERWNPDEALLATLAYGADGPGHFVVGEQAIHLAQQTRLNGPPPIEEADIALEYERVVQQMTTADSGIVPGSSAGGEQAKFTACIERDGQPRQVIVKFSGSRDTEVGQRWAELLTAEHLALRCLREHGVAAAETRVVEVGNRTLLEVERFDRVQQYGRRACVSLRPLVAAFDGGLFDPWPETGARLVQGGWISEHAHAQLELLYWFGTLIGNNDMHYGNAAVELSGNRPFELCPAYDMLPMAYAPTRQGDLPEPILAPPVPRPEALPLWRRAASIAEQFWTKAELPCARQKLEAVRRLAALL